MTTLAERPEAATAKTGYLTAAAMVRDWANKAPDRIALREKDFGIWQEITWAEYWDVVLNAAHGLLALGVDVGDRVSIHSEDRPEWVILDTLQQSLFAESPLGYIRPIRRLKCSTCFKIRARRCTWLRIRSRPTR